MGPITSTTVGPIINSKMSPTIDATTATQSRIATSLQYHPNPRITSLFFYRKFTREARWVEGAPTVGRPGLMAAARIRRAALWRCAHPVLARECGFEEAAGAAVSDGEGRRLPSDRKGQHIPRAAFGALPPLPQIGDKRPWRMPFYEVFNRPRVPLSAGVAADADDRDLAMALERGQRHIPDLAGLLSHGEMIRATRWLSKGLAEAILASDASVEPVAQRRQL